MGAEGVGIAKGCIGFCGAFATVFTVVGFSSSVSQKSQIAIAATTKTITTMSGQFSLPNEKDDACAVCGAEFAFAAGVAAAGAGVCPAGAFCVDGIRFAPKFVLGVFAVTREPAAGAVV